MSTSTTSKHHIQYRIVNMTILLLGFILRVHRLGTQAFTGDEAFSIVNWTHGSLVYLFTTIATIDPQLPIPILSLRLWVHLTGETEFASRTLSVLAGTITIATAFTVTRILANKRAASLAMILCAINPFLIWHSQDLRPYSLWIAVSSLAFFAFLTLTTSHHSFRQWPAYIIAAVMSMYTYYLEAFQLLAQNLAMLPRTQHRRKLLIPWIFAQLTVAVLFTPWLMRPEIRNSTYAPTASIPNIPEAFQALLLGTTIPTDIIPRDAQQLLTLTLIVLSILVLWRTRPLTTSATITTFLFTPILALTTLTFISQQGYFRPRYVAVTAFTLVILIALFLDSMTHPQAISKAMPIGALTILISLTGISLLNYYYNPAFFKAPDWHTLTQVLTNQTASTDTVIFNYPDPAFTHYFRGPADSYVYPTTANPPQYQANHDIEELLTTYEYLWFVPVYDRTWDGQQVIARALTSQSQLISEQWIGPTHLLQFSSWEPNQHHIQVASKIQLGDLATVEGYRTTPPQQFWLPGTPIHLEVFFKPLRQLDTNLTVFCHLLGPTKPDGSPLWDQDDYPPQDGRTTTSSWIPGSIIRDTYTLTLPKNTQPTIYTITIGLYNPQTSNRYQLQPTIVQAEPNGATLLTFTVNPSAQK